MASVSVVNPKADVLRKSAAVAANCNAARGLMEVLKTNLGPRGTLKMLVGGAGQIKVTKDGNVLLHEMQIQHPTAAMIARASTAQDSITGDGTASTVLIIGEIMRQAENYLFQGIHPRLLCEGLDRAKQEILNVLEDVKVTQESFPERELLECVARTSLRTKLPQALADQLKEIVVDAILCIRGDDPDKSLDLFMIEVLHMKQHLATDSQFIRGMVMDHGTRHPDMPKRLKNCYILTCNVSLEYEKTEVNSGFFYSSTEQRERLVDAERRFTDEKVKKIIEFKRQVCTPENKKTFVVFNQKGIDPPSLDMLAREGIMALRRVKRRNMERLTLCCGGNALNSVYDMRPEDLGYAGEVYEQSLGDEKWTFVEGVAHPKSCAILVKGPNDHTIAQIKDAVRDGLRAVRNVIEDKAVVPGAGAFEIAAACRLQEFARKELVGKVRFGAQLLADALLIIPKTLADNAGLDSQDCILRVIEEHEKTKALVGIDLSSGKPMASAIEGVWDNYCVKKQMLTLAQGLSQQLLLVDEIIKAGKQMGGSK